MEATMQDWERLAAAIKEARIRKGYAKRAPFSRDIEIDDSTMAIIEGKRPGHVSDEMLDYVTGKLGWPAGQWRAVMHGLLRPLDEFEVDSAADEFVGQMDARLSAFSDAELLNELRARMLWMAAKLGGSALAWSVDTNGDPVAVSHSVPRVNGV